MSDDMFDDGLVHGHSWASEPARPTEAPLIADASAFQTPSTVHQDEHVHPC